MECELTRCRPDRNRGRDLAAVLSSCQGGSEAVSEGLDVFSPSLGDHRIGVAELDHGVHHEAAPGAGGKHRLEPIEELMNVVKAASTMGELSVDLSGQACQVVFESRVEQASLVPKGVVEAGPDDPG